jgi:hypothetical protein
MSLTVSAEAARGYFLSGLVLFSVLKPTHSVSMGYFPLSYLKRYVLIWHGEVDMVILQLLFHAMMAIFQFVSFLAIAFVTSNLFKSGS